MPKLHVLLKREDLDAARLRDQVVVVLDILFATTTIVHAFECGVASVHVADDRDDALRIARDIDGCLLAGEMMGEGLLDFAPSTPLALAGHALLGRDLVYCTTNGTRALLAANPAAHIYAGALTNGAALADRIVRDHPDADVLIVCAGSVGRFNLEDFHGAGHIVAALQARADYALSDAALAARLAYRADETRAVLQASRVGRLIAGLGLQAEVDHAVIHDNARAVPKLVDARRLQVTA